MEDLPVNVLVGMDILQSFKSIVVSESGPDLVVATVLPELVKINEDLFDLPLSKALAKEIQQREIISIPTDTKPKQAAIHRVSPSELAALEEQIPLLEEQGVIEKSSSPWRHTPVVVPKRDGGMRIAVNYKLINQYTSLVNFIINYHC